MILSSVAALVIASFGLHFSARSLCARVSGGKQIWSPRSSAAVVAVLLLLFCITLAGAGIVHQVGWLRSETWIESSYGPRALMSRRLSSLQFALQEWAENHDFYPHHLAELLENDEKRWIRDPLLVHLGSEFTPEPWIFLAAGKSTKGPFKKPLLVSPRPNEKGLWFAVFWDRRYAFLSEADYKELMAVPDSEP